MALTHASKEGFTIWFTGLPSSGKSTLAEALAKRLLQTGLKVECLDGDVIRSSLTSDLGFSREDRDRNIEIATFLAKILTRNGIVVITSFVSPYREKRLHARKEIGSFVEVYIKCPIEECMRRDVKGLYKKALQGEIKDFTGISHPYEEPEHPEIVVETDKQSSQESVDAIMCGLKSLGYPV